jgi:hypothetical protein
MSNPIYAPDIDIESLVVQWRGEQRRLIDILETASHEERLFVLKAFVDLVARMQAVVIELADGDWVN